MESTPISSYAIGLTLDTGTLIFFAFSPRLRKHFLIQIQNTMHVHNLNHPLTP